MNRIGIVAMVVFASGAQTNAVDRPSHVPGVVFAVHGGLGSPREEVSEEHEAELRATLEHALQRGFDALAKPQSSGLDAVETAIRALEDSPLFNAGKGAVFTNEGRNELDASIMEGKTRRAGAVAGVTVVKNPISAARAVLEKSPHVLLIGRGAEVFCSQNGLEIVEPEYFSTLPRRRQIEEHWARSKQQPPKGWKKHSSGKPADGKPADRKAVEGETKHIWGTVGAVALDALGNLAAGTSTGGISGKAFGRVGDSPIIGAGTYADNDGCAVSCTGHGEYFIRYVVAHEIDALMKYERLPVEEAVDQMVNQTLKEAGGEGGVIALDAKGNYAAAHNSEALFRGYVTRDGTIEVLLFDD
ncbi:MAG TPA: isoaspartyl peptidase/L-asparaginase [Pirellulales bacterium]|nr:isoaspartyl peptidase/L-asparaginase [Pirellulales bacterium]